MSQFALVIAQQSAHLYKLGGKQADHIATASAEDVPAAWLEIHLHTKAYCTVVSDIMDESYMPSNIPPIWLPSTRDQLVQRRLMQQLRDAPYRAAALVPSGSFRPPVRASLIGLGQSERITEWLTALAAREARIKGLWPMSAVIALAVNTKAKRRVRSKAANAPPSSPPTLAVVATSGGLRQVLVRGALPLFSRFSVSTSQDSFSASNVLQEARRTVQYLSGQDWLTVDEQPIATQLWLPVGDEQALVDAVNDPLLDVQSITPVVDAYASMLPLLKKAPANLQFLPESFRLSWRAAQIASISTVVGFVAVILATLGSAGLLWDSMAARKIAVEELAASVSINKRARQEVLQAKGDLSQAGLAVASVEAWEKAIAKQPDQVAAMQHLAGALKMAPSIVIEKIVWSLPVMPVEVAGAAAETPQPFGCTNPAAASDTAPNPSAEPNKPSVAILSFTALLPDDIVPRQALQFQADVLAKLNADGWTAILVKSTVTLEPTQTQAGTVGKPNPRGFELCMQKAGT